MHGAAHGDGIGGDDNGDIVDDGVGVVAGMRGQATYSVTGTSGVQVDGSNDYVHATCGLAEKVQIKNFKVVISFHTTLLLITNNLKKLDFTEKNNFVQTSYIVIPLKFNNDVKHSFVMEIVDRSLRTLWPFGHKHAHITGFLLVPRNFQTYFNIFFTY